MPGCNVEDGCDAVPDQMQGAVQSGFPREQGYRIVFCLVENDLDLCARRAADRRKKLAATWGVAAGL